MLRTAVVIRSLRHASTKAPDFVGRGTPCIGIRRETINAWERRAPLAPSHVKKLIKRGVKVIIQPSNRRAFSIQDYISAGAIVHEDLSPAHLIMSVKQVPVEQLIPNKTYAFFSHTIKAQQDNMEMLDTILHRKIRLIDYEKIVNQDGRRLVMFGKWAGYAGFTNILHGLGLRLLALGHHTPFLHIALAHNYRDCHMAINAVRDCGYEIALNRLPRSIGPLIFVFTGSGNVSQGAQELFSHLPHEYIDATTLPMVARKGHLNKVYGCVVTRQDHMVRKAGGKYNKDEFQQHPDRYVSKFAAEIAPYATVIINGVYWGVNTPRLITIPDAKHLLTPTGNTPFDVPGCPSLPHRLMAICDISADPGGSIEFMAECTTIDKPFNIYDADFNKTSESFNNPSGVLVCSIDNMPAQVPIESTEQFGDLISPYIFDMLNCSTDQPIHKLQCRDLIKDAIITSDGKLTPRYEYIAELRQKQRRSNYKTMVTTRDATKQVLLLGAGMVSAPVADYYSQQRNVNLTVAADNQHDGQMLAAKGDNITSAVVDVNKDPEVIADLINKHDLVISLLPFTYHTAIAKMCIRNRTNMITTSYISPEMEALDLEAKQAEITIMHECGLDPGIDHMLAADVFDRVHASGGKITSFVSFCGGLPAPEASDNAMRYKFSWSPKGVLLALMNEAKYLKNGSVVEIPGDGSVIENTYPIDFMPGFNLIGYPNRDSTKYSSIYGIERECHTLLRGTLRYQGFEKALRALKDIGLLSLERNNVLNPNFGPDLTWKQVTASLTNNKMDIFPEQLRNVVAEKLGQERKRELEVMDELGLFSPTIVDRQFTPIDTLVSHLAKKLSYGKGERDLVILNHDIIAQLSAGQREKHRISLVTYGEPDGYSAMARTVGYTCAIVSHMMLTGEIQRKGMLRPIFKEVYRPTLKRLEDYGIRATTKITPVDQFLTG